MGREGLGSGSPSGKELFHSDVLGCWGRWGGGGWGGAAGDGLRVEHGFHGKTMHFI